MPIIMSDKPLLASVKASNLSKSEKNHEYTAMHTATAMYESFTVECRLISVVIV
jgi:hypothetical protein